jgi:hypothetical protein
LSWLSVRVWQGPELCDVAMVILRRRGGEEEEEQKEQTHLKI